MLFPVIRQGRKSLMPLVLPRLLGPLTVEPPSCLLLSHSHIFFASTGRKLLMFALGWQWHPLPPYSTFNYSSFASPHHRVVEFHPLNPVTAGHHVAGNLTARQELSSGTMAAIPFRSIANPRPVGLQLPAIPVQFPGKRYCA